MVFAMASPRGGGGGGGGSGEKATERDKEKKKKEKKKKKKTWRVHPEFTGLNNLIITAELTGLCYC